MNKKQIKKFYFLLLRVVSKNNYLKSIKLHEHLVILNLHKVSDETNPFYPPLSTHLFEELLKFISIHFNVITFSEIKNHTQSDKPCLILSFDDGFYDFFENAMPILKKYNVKANLNVIPQCIENGKPVWDVMLGDILNSVSADEINKLDLPGFNMVLGNSNRGRYGLALTRYLKNMTQKRRENIWLKIIDIANESNVRLTKMLNLTEVQEISETHEIGVHSYSHESMAIESKEFFEADFGKCEDYFKDTLKLPMNIYAFPSGSYNDYHIGYLLAHDIQHVLLVGENYSSYSTQVHHRFTYYAESNCEVRMRAVGFSR